MELFKVKKVRLHPNGDGATFNVKTDQYATLIREEMQICERKFKKYNSLSHMTGIKYIKLEQPKPKGRPKKEVESKEDK